MANLSFSSTATLTINGITPADGPTSTIRESASFTGAATSADDRMVQTFVINASTTATALDLGKITSGQALWVQVDGPLHVTVTQDLGAGPVDAVVRVESFMFLNSEFLALKVANPSATTAVRLSIAVVGDRDAVGGGPGVF